MGKHWTAEQVLDLARSFQGACVVTAAAELDVFNVLRPTRQTAESLAGKLRANPHAMAVLLDALAAMGLLVKKGDRYGLAPGLEETLTDASPRNVLPMARHSGTCLRKWAQLGQVVKTGRPARVIPSIHGEKADREAFIGAMHAINIAMAPRLVADLGPPPFRHLLDVGGGSGTWTIAFLRAAPTATATLFDLPQVVPLARKRLAAEGMAGRVTLVAGDYTRDKLPRGADLAWVSATVHQESLEGMAALFRNVFAALEPGGRILIRDIVMHTSRTRPAMGALFAVNMLVATEAGGTYTLAEMSHALKAAGFVRPRLLRKADDMSAVVAAVKPTAKG
ncbi:MAG: methyltransferase domain-containing protein [Planctomycetes bacterium]|nr:methyltransferase domain-containing protein [Planctomycetota bacterium]